MIHIRDAGLFFFGLDLRFELAGHALKIRDHHVDLRKLARFILYLEMLQTKQVFTRFHTQYPLKPIICPAKRTGLGNPNSLKLTGKSRQRQPNGC